MQCSFYRLNEAQTGSLLAVPESVLDLLGNSTPPPKIGFWSRIFGKSQDQGPIQRQKLDPVAESETFELNQAWHILHYLLSGNVAEGNWPSTFIMSGGQEIGPDLGYGPARLLTTEFSADVADFLAAQSLQSLDAAYVQHDIEAANIYWQVSSEITDRRRQIEELWSVTQDMRSFFQKTVQVHGAALIQIY